MLCECCCQRFCEIQTSQVQPQCSLPLSTARSSMFPAKSFVLPELQTFAHIDPCDVRVTVNASAGVDVPPAAMWKERAFPSMSRRLADGVRRGATTPLSQPCQPLSVPSHSRTLSRLRAQLFEHAGIQSLEAHHTFTSKQGSIFI